MSHTLESLRVEQYLLAFLFLGCYSMALSHFVGPRARHWAVAGAITAATAFAACADAWEHGVLVVAVALVALGLFAAACWLLWALCGWADATAPGPQRAGRDIAPHPTRGS
ncbi:MAG TPA: hypothetical protein VFX50_05315 [Gemmatimonadales bacterium]|nr:hypothetical protein [Gemmatimonadales bacterium]